MKARDEILSNIRNAKVGRGDERGAPLFKKRSRVELSGKWGEIEKHRASHMEDLVENFKTECESILGKVYVAEFFFTTCPTICPIMNKNLVQLQEEFREFEDFGVASFTINPVYDTPSVLKAYAEAYGITDMDWHLLTGDAEQIYELANSGFNIYAQQMPEVPGGFEHSGLFALIDREGYIRSRKDDYGNPIVYYRGSIPLSQGKNEAGETEQISILKEDIRKLLESENGE